MKNIVFEAVNEQSGRFAYVHRIMDDVFRLRYGKGRDCSGYVVDDLSCAEAQDLACMWANGIDTDDMDYAIDIIKGS